MDQTKHINTQIVDITLRDYFAAVVIQGICASGPGPQLSNAFLASEAYAIADAMLAARK